MCHSVPFLCRQQTYPGAARQIDYSGNGSPSCLYCEALKSLSYVALSSETRYFGSYSGSSLAARSGLDFFDLPLLSPAPCSCQSELAGGIEHEFSVVLAAAASAGGLAGDKKKASKAICCSADCQLEPSINEMMVASGLAPPGSLSGRAARANGMFVRSDSVEIRPAFENGIWGCLRRTHELFRKLEK